MTLDRLVVARGAAAGLLLAVPATIANGILADQADPSFPLSVLTLLGVAAGFALAGFSAGHERPDDARRHGLAAVLWALLIVELLAILGRLDRGDPVSIVAIALTALIAIGAGTIGSNAGANRKTGRSPS